MTIPQPPTPPGWYPNPSGAPGQQYWDGTAWSAAPAASPLLPPPGYAAAPQIPVKHGMSKTKKIAIGVGGGVLALAAIGSIGDSGSSSERSSSSSSAIGSGASPSTGSGAPKETASEGIAPAGSSVRDGKFEFAALGANRSSSVPGMFDPEQAKGEFYTVTMRITNVGDKAQTFFASNQKLIVNGNEYKATSSLSDDTWMVDINPGLGIDAKVTFDVPPGAVPEAIECHDSAFSSGEMLGLPRG
jgi:hypothetical protein